MITEAILKYKKQLVLFGFCVLVIVLGGSLWNYLRFGSISVVTDNGNTITISELPGGSKNGQKLFSKTAKERLSVRVSPGKYIVSVSNKASYINKAVTVRAGEDNEYNLNPSKETGLEPVIGMLANSMYPSNQGLSFIESGSGILFRITDANRLIQVSNIAGFQRAEWSDYGIGAAEDSKGNIYRLVGDDVRKISLPGPFTVNKTFCVSPDGTIYIIKKDGIYAAGASEKPRYVGGWEDSALPFIAASNKRLAIIVPPPNDSSADKQMEEPFVEIIDKSGNLKAKKNLSALAGSWSPDGTKLILTDFYGNTGIYNERLELLKTLPNIQVLKAAWANNEKVVYTTDNRVWLYSIKDGLSRAFSSLPLGLSVVSISINKGSGQVYLSGGGEEKSGIYRFSLSGEEDSGLDSIKKLAVFLPVALDSCRISYINFSEKPSIILQTTPKNKSVCISQTDIELTQDGLNRKDFDFQFDLASDNL